MRDDAGKILCWAGINLDVRRLKETEHALRESEERQRLALSAARLAQWEWDIQADRFAHHNSLRLLFGRGEDQPFANVGEFQEAVHPEDRETVRTAIGRAMTPGVPYEAEYRVVWPDGSAHWLASRGATFFDAGGAPARMIGVHLDITHRKNSEAQIRELYEALEERVVERTAELAAANMALREGEQRFQAIFNSTFQFMGVISPQGRLLEANQTALTFAGVTREDVIGRLAWETPWCSHSPKTQDLLKWAVAEAASGRFVRYEQDHFGPDGQTVTVDFSINPVKDETGRVVLLITEGRDISERKAAEKKLVDAMEAAEEATRAKSNFLANMSHEIRTPMSGVIGMTELLLDTPLDSVQQSYAETIRSSGEALLTVINDILDFSKIEAGKMTLETVSFDLRAMIKEVANLLAPRAGQKSLEVVCLVAPDVPALLRGDPIRIRQVLTNLAGNAVKFTDRGKVELEAVLTADGEDAVTLRILARDTGIGIPAGRHADVFDSFTQIEGGNSRRFGGTGLGLAICRSLVELMGGTMGLESREGEGSTFWFELLLGKAPEAPTMMAGQAAAPPETSLALPRAFLVLMAEDNEVNRRVAIGMAKRVGCELEAVCNGREALEALDYNRHSLILMDVQMPEMDGFAATAAIREREQGTGRHIPIVALTAHAMEGDRERCLAAGMDDYLTKPIRPAPFVEVLRKWVLTEIASRPRLVHAVMGIPRFL